jgi:hypothetical protein
MIGILDCPVGLGAFMRIAQVAPLAESVPPKLERSEWSPGSRRNW